MTEHKCEGVAVATKEGYSHCMPMIDKDGVHGCDDSLVAPVKFCPFCGEPWRDDWTTEPEQEG